MPANQDLLERITAQPDVFGESLLSVTCEYLWNCWRIIPV